MRQKSQVAGLFIYPWHPKKDPKSPFGRPQGGSIPDAQPKNGDKRGFLVRPKEVKTGRIP
jgi:hypothetical protein